VQYATMFEPRHSAYFASYFTITGLHGLHVLGGVLVFIYMWLPVSKRLYQRNPEHLANRVEVSGLFWHFVDLVWIFVFPLFYLL
jgi:cytochrome c oxidase subunit 3